MPEPGVSSIAEAMSANRSWPAARSPSIACSLVVPGGMCLDITPEKITSMARPITRGAYTASTTDTAFMTNTAVSAILYGASSPSRRLADGQNCLALRGALLE